MRYVTAVVLLAVLTACGGGGSSPKSGDSPAAATSLKTTCAALADALPKDSYDTTSMRAFLDDLVALNNASDGAARAALRPLATPAANLAGQTTADRHLAFLQALNQVAASCRAAGSTALN